MSKESTENLLGSLVTEELNNLSSKMGFWGLDIVIPQAEIWKSGKGSLTLKKFLNAHPLPPSNQSLPIWGIAWEFIWGTPTPDAIKNAKEALLIRARTGMNVSEIEQIWLKVMAVDTDMF